MCAVWTAVQVLVIALRVQIVVRYLSNPVSLVGQCDALPCFLCQHDAAALKRQTDTHPPIYETLAVLKPRVCQNMATHTSPTVTIFAYTASSDLVIHVLARVLSL